MPDSHASRSKIRILFLNPPSLTGEVWMKEVGRCGRKAIGGEVWPQTGLAYLAAMVEKEGQTASIVDAMAESVTVESLESLCREMQPHIIIANSATPTLKNDAQVLQRLSRATNALCGFSGPHVSALPEDTLKETQADFGIINEGEETLAELTALAVRSNGQKEALRERLGEIKGIVWKSASGEIVLNPARPLIDDIDTLPLPARHLLPNASYHMPFFGKNAFATIIPTRGCPWPCTFCRAGRVWGRKIRVRSVVSILEEIESLQRDFGIRHIVFMTDSLTLNKKWAAELFAGLRQMPKPVEWICNSRVDAVDEDILRMMKQAGCRQVAYGLESGSQAILDNSRKGIKLEQSREAIRLTRKAGLLSMAYFVLGLPGETEATIEESVRFAQRINPDYVNFHIATPFPGTELYDQALANGWLLSHDWNDFEEEGSVVMQAGTLSPEQLIEAQHRAMKAFYMRPTRLLRELSRLRSWDDFAAKARAGIKVFSTLGKRHK